MKAFAVTVLFAEHGRMSYYVRYGFDIMDIEALESRRYQGVAFLSLTVEEV